MSAAAASDEVTDAIASIEMHRQEIEKESGRAASCNFSLRKLQELLQQEQQALQLHGPDSVHHANVEAVTGEIGRVKGLGSGGSSRQNPKGTQPRPPQGGWRNPQRRSGRTRGRRTMGRRGER